MNQFNSKIHKKNWCSNKNSWTTATKDCHLCSEIDTDTVRFINLIGKLPYIFDITKSCRFSIYLFENKYFGKVTCCRCSLKQTLIFRDKLLVEVVNVNLWENLITVLTKLGSKYLKACDLLNCKIWKQPNNIYKINLWNYYHYKKNNWIRTSNLQIKSLVKYLFIYNS